MTWESVNTRTYYLQSSTNLAAQPAFFTIQSNIVGQVGTTSYTDTTAIGPGRTSIVWALETEAVQ